MTLFNRAWKSLLGHKLFGARRERKQKFQQRRIVRQRRLLLEQMELRITPAMVVSLTGDAVVFQGDAANDSLTLSEDSSGYMQHDLALGGNLVSSIDLDSAAPGEQALLGPDVSAITIWGGDGDDEVDARTWTGVGITMHGEAGYDWMGGSEGDDVFFGGTGWDGFYATTGDTMHGGTDFDYVIFYDAKDVVVTDTELNSSGVIVSNPEIEEWIFEGTEDADSIDASAWTGGYVRIQGFGGNDVLKGGSGDDDIDGGEGDDVLHGGAGNDLLEGDQWNGVSTGIDEIEGGAGYDNLYLTAGDLFQGGEGGASAHWSRVSQAVLTDTALTINGLVYTLTEFDVTGWSFRGTENADSIDASGYTNGVSIYGLGGDDVLKGGGLNSIYGRNFIYGGDGDDVLEGGANDDTFDSSVEAAGNDQVVGRAGSDQFYIAGSDVIDSGSGTADRVVLSQVTQMVITDSQVILHGATSSIAGIEIWEINGTSGSDSIDGSALTSGWLSILGLEGNDILKGGSGNDILRGSEGDDYVDGGAGDDTLDLALGSRPGNDTLSGGPGNDKLGAGTFDTVLGGGGSDSVTVTDVTQVVLTNSSYVTSGVTSSNHEIETWVFYGTPGNDTIDLSGWTGSGITITCYEGDDTVKGGAGDDTIYGRQGNDTLEGNDGKDKLYGEDGDDVLHGGNGDDTLLGAAGNDILMGNGGNDSLTGDAGNDQLMGHDGNDSLSGGTDNDQLMGNGGNDSLSGDAGNDELMGHDGNDSINCGEGDDHAQGGEGDDGISGYSGNDTLWGDSGNDRLDSGDGDDLIFGGDGDDYLDWYSPGSGDNDTFYPGSGANRLSGHGATCTVILEGKPTLDEFVIGSYGYSLNGETTYFPYAGLNNSGLATVTYHSLGGDDSVQIASGLPFPVYVTGRRPVITLTKLGQLIEGVFSDPGENQNWTGTIDYGSGPQPLTIASNKTFSFTLPFVPTGGLSVSITIEDNEGNAGVKSFVFSNPPQIGGITGAQAVAYTENAAPVLIASGATVSDPDSVNFAAGTLTVGISANGSADDRLSILHTSDATGKIGVDYYTRTIRYSGVPIATYIGGAGTTPLVITFNASASQSAVLGTLKAINFANVSDNPSAAPREVSFVLTDGAGGTSDTQARTVNITATNDDPVLAGPYTTVEYVENGPPVIVGPSILITDVDSADFESGMLKILSSGQATDRFGIEASGPIGVSGNTVSYEGVPIGTFTGTTSLSVALNSAATPARVEELARHIVFSSLSDAPSSGLRIVNFALWDGDGGLHEKGVFIKTTPVNDAPVLTLSDTVPAKYAENAAALLISSGASVTDVDSVDFDTGTLTVVLTGNGVATDKLSIKHSAPAANKVSVDYVLGKIRYTSSSSYAYEVGSFVGGNGTDPLIITFNFRAMKTEVQAVMKAITFVNTSDDPTSNRRTVSFTLTDGDGGTSNTVLRSIDVTAKNDASVIANFGPAVTYSGAPVILSDTATVSDPDSANFLGGKLSVTLTTNRQTFDRIEISEGDGITVSGTNVSYNGKVIGYFTGTTTFAVTFTTSDATAAAAEALLRRITFRTTSTVALARTVSVTVRDGDGGTSLATTKSVNVA